MNILPIQPDTITPLGRLTLQDGRWVLFPQPGALDRFAEPERSALLRALPGTGMRWAIGELDDWFVQRADPGELVIVVEDLAEADRWMHAICKAEGIPLPWMTPKPRRRVARR